MGIQMHQILHVVVVGFHHKKGCVVEFAYPPLEGDGEGGLPGEWSNLPSLALPDGAHNTEQDVVYFMLPSREQSDRAVFGISCYRQIAAEELLAKDADVTRSTVQKSVCVLSRVPLFGVLRAKLQLITQAYFNERDFAKVEVLSQMHGNLCEMFEGDLVDGQGAFMDISPRALVKRFKHRLLVLFKLVLLERRVVFHMFPVQLLGDTMVALMSLFPRMLEEGLFYAATVDPRAEAAAEKRKAAEQAKKEQEQAEEREKEEGVEQAEEAVGGEIVIPGPEDIDDDPIKQHDAHGFPLSIFTRDNLFHPYLSISYLDMIRSPAVRGYMVGATNALFVQRKDLVDAIVTLSDGGDGCVDVQDGELRRQLQLTTADLRFADYLIKHVEQSDDDSAVWEGGDEWLRVQLRAYLLSLAASARADLAVAVADYGTPFVDAWRTTRNYGIWMRGQHDDLVGVPPGHAFAGQLNVWDAVLRVEHAVSGSEGAKKALSAISSTGKQLGETGSRVKSSFTGWFKSASEKLTSPSNPTASEEKVEQAQEAQK